MSRLLRKRILIRNSKAEIALADAVIKQTRDFFGHRLDRFEKAGINNELNQAIITNFGLCVSAVKQLTNLGNVLISASPTDRTEVLKAAAPNVLTNLQRFERVLKFMKGETPNSRSGRKTKNAKRKTSSPEVVEIFSSDDEEKNAEMGAPKADRNRFESSSSDFSVELGAERVDDDIEIIAIIEKCVTEMEKYSSTDIILESFVKKEEPPAPAENAEEKKELCRSQPADCSSYDGPRGDLDGNPDDGRRPDPGGRPGVGHRPDPDEHHGDGHRSGPEECQGVGHRTDPVGRQGTENRVDADGPKGIAEKSDETVTKKKKRRKVAGRRPKLRKKPKVVVSGYFEENTEDANHSDPVNATCDDGNFIIQADFVKDDVMAKEFGSTVDQREIPKRKSLRASPYMLRSGSKVASSAYLWTVAPSGSGPQLAPSAHQWTVAPPPPVMKDLMICIQRIIPVQSAAANSVPIFGPAEGSPPPAMSPCSNSTPARKKFNPTAEDLAKWEEEKRKNDQYFVVPKTPKVPGARKRSRKESPAKESLDPSPAADSSSAGRFRVVVPEFECKCGKAFVTERDLKYHKTLHHGSQEVCRKCLAEMRGPGDRRDHRLRHAVVVYVCEPCNRMFTSEKQLEIHENSKTHGSLASAYDRGAKTLHRISMGAQTPSRKVPQTPGGLPLGNVQYRLLTPQLQKILRKYGANSIARPQDNDGIQLRKDAGPEMSDCDELLTVPYPTPPPSSGIMHELPPLPPWEQDEEQLDEQEGEREREQQYFETIDCSNRQHLPPDAYGAISQIMNQPTCSWFSMPPIVTDCLDAVKVGACSESSMIVTNSSFMESSNFGEFYQEDNADLFSPQIDGGLGTYDLPNSSISNENWSEFPSTSDDPMTSPIPVQMMEFLEQPNLLTPVRPDPEACLASSETLHTPLYADLNGPMIADSNSTESYETFFATSL